MGNKDKVAFGVERSDRRYRLRLARYQALAEQLRDHIALAAPDPERKLSYLEVGVGTARTLRYYEALGIDRRLELHAVDISPGRLGRVYRHEDWQLHQGDAQERFPFDDASFDIVVSEQLLEHLQRPERAIAEVGRVLRPGGLAVIGVPTFPPGISHLRPIAVKLRESLFNKVEGHIQTFTARSIARRIEGSGWFEDVRVRGYRLLSGGLLAPLEDYHWWYRFNRRLGAALPGLCIEVQVSARRRATPALPGPGA